MICSSIRVKENSTNKSQNIDNLSSLVYSESSQLHEYEHCKMIIINGQKFISGNKHLAKTWLECNAMPSSGYAQLMMTTMMMCDAYCLSSGKPASAGLRLRERIGDDFMSSADLGASLLSQALLCDAADDNISIIQRSREANANFINCFQQILRSILTLQMDNRQHCSMPTDLPLSSCKQLLCAN